MPAVTELPRILWLFGSALGATCLAWATGALLARLGPGPARLGRMVATVAFGVVTAVYVAPSLHRPPVELLLGAIVPYPLIASEPGRALALRFLVLGEVSLLVAGAGIDFILWRRGEHLPVAVALTLLATMLLVAATAHRFEDWSGKAVAPDQRE